MRRTKVYAMVTDRDVQEAAARCVAIVVFHQNATQRNGGTGRMVAELHDVAEWVKELGGPNDHIERQVLRLVRRELLNRFSAGPARRLNSLVARGFNAKSKVQT
jgi:hypothetical protein